MKVTIDLPHASQFDAEAFGLWLDMVLRAAETATEIGDITVHT